LTDYLPGGIDALSRNVLGRGQIESPKCVWLLLRNGKRVNDFKAGWRTPAKRLIFAACLSMIYAEQLWAIAIPFNNCAKSITRKHVVSINLRFWPRPGRGYLGRRSFISWAITAAAWLVTSNIAGNHSLNSRRESDTAYTVQ